MGKLMQVKNNHSKVNDVARPLRSHGLIVQELKWSHEGIHKAEIAWCNSKIISVKFLSASNSREKAAMEAVWQLLARTQLTSLSVLSDAFNVAKATQNSVSRNVMVSAPELASASMQG